MEEDLRAEETPEAGAGERTIRALAVSVLVLLALFGIWLTWSWVILGLR